MTGSFGSKEKDIEAQSANAAIVTMQHVDCWSSTFNNADIIYSMEPWEGTGSLFDNDIRLFCSV